MRWHVAAEGDAPPGLHEEIAARVGKLLSLGKYGTDASQFSGEGINGPVHVTAEAEDAPDA